MVSIAICRLCLSFIIFTDNLTAEPMQDNKNHG